MRRVGRTPGLRSFRLRPPLPLGEAGKISWGRGGRGYSSWRIAPSSSYYAFLPDWHAQVKGHAECSAAPAPCGNDARALRQARRMRCAATVAAGLSRSRMCSG